MRENEIRRLITQLPRLAERLGFEFEPAPESEWKQPSDSPYLRAEERENPDIMANVEAMRVTNALVHWIGRDRQGYVGLWRGPGGLPLDQAPVIRLDTEGQYEVLASSIGDYLAEHLGEDDFEAVRAELVACGFEVSSELDDIFGDTHGEPQPGTVRSQHYRAARARAGLSPV